MSCDHELANEWARCSGKKASYITNSCIIWLAPRVGRWTKSHAVIGYPSGQDGAILTSRDYLLDHQKPYNKFFINQLYSVKMAGCWPHSLFASLWTKKELDQYPAILTLHLVHIFSLKDWNIWHWLKCCRQQIIAFSFYLLFVIISALFEFTVISSYPGIQIWMILHVWESFHAIYLLLTTLSAPVLFRLGISPSSSFFLASLRLLSTRPALLLLIPLVQSILEQGLELLPLSNVTSPGSEKQITKNKFRIL